MTSTSRRTEFDDRAFGHRLAAEAYEAIRRHYALGNGRVLTRLDPPLAAWLRGIAAGSSS